MPGGIGLTATWNPALADLLFGDASPSGRLPVTFERRWDDNPVHSSCYPEPGTHRIVYQEGVFVGYRGCEHNGTNPLFPFGYGLSYTTFAYRDLSITPVGGEWFEVSFSATNTGGRPGADVPQIYVRDTHARVPRPRALLLRRRGEEVARRAGRLRDSRGPLV